MKEDAVTHQHYVEPPLAYRLFKYAVYLLLSMNIFWFFLEDHGAVQATFPDGVGWHNLVEAYSATFDTAAWVILLLLFELETAVIPDHHLKGGLKWFLAGVRAVCSGFIVWDFWGYCVKYGLISNLVPLAVTDACSLVGQGMTFIEDLDDYLPLTAESCLALQGQALVQVSGTDIIGTVDAANEAVRLAIVDIINAGDWLLIVALLEVEVWLQLRHELSDRLMNSLKGVKVVLYAVLFLCAAYWGWKGDFIDFWDAFLWLVAFIFIEMNLFQWHQEVKEEEAHARERESDGAIPTEP